MIRQVFVAVLLCGSAAAQAQQYRWIDKDGRVQFTDAPPPASAKDVRKAATPAPAAATAPDAGPPLPYEIARLQKDFPVTLYTSSSCKEGCDNARATLNKRGIPFKEILVADPETTEELRRVAGALEVPTMLVGHSVERGFEQGAFDAALDSAGYPKAGMAPPRSQKAPGAPGEAKPAAKAAEVREKLGPYDPSGLQGPAPKPGIYDPSGLEGPPPKPGTYGLPANGK